MRIARVFGAAMLIAPSLPAGAVASDVAARALLPVKLATQSPLASLEQDKAVLVKLGAVTHPSRTVPLQRPQATPAAVVLPIVKASVAPDLMLRPQNAEPAIAALVSSRPSVVLGTMPLVLRPQAEALAESEFEAGAPIVATRLDEPLTVIVSMKDQQLDVYRGLERIKTTRISSGKKGYETLTGVFGILQKKREHFSNLYDDAPMPHMQRLTRSGTALHAGQVPNHPASRGCVRMPDDFASRLFHMTEIGGKVAMMNGPMPTPKPIDHPALFEIEPEMSAGSRVAAGAGGAARAAAEVSVPSNADPSRETGPLHMLITRREHRDIATGAQEILAAMGYLAPQDRFVGHVGKRTKQAIKAFEKDHGLRPRGRLTTPVATKIYEAAGQAPLPHAYLFLRKGFSHVRRVPVTIKDTGKTLGTHLFTYTRAGDGFEPLWTGISLEGEDPEAVLDRITIPDGIRAEISVGLSPGATLIVADEGSHSSVLPEGDDFIVRTNDSPEANPQAEAKKPKKVVAKPRKKRAKQRTVRTRSAETRKVTRQRGRRLFSRRR